MFIPFIKIISDIFLIEYRQKRRPDGAPLDLYDIAAPILSFAKNTGRTSLPVSDFVTRW